MGRQGFVNFCNLVRVNQHQVTAIHTSIDVKIKNHFLIRRQFAECFAAKVLYVGLYLNFNLSHFVDISELNLPKTCTLSFPNGKDDLMNFEVTIRPDEGYYL